MTPGPRNLLAAAALTAASVHAEPAQPPTRGEYLLHVAGCVTCHTRLDDEGPRLAGGPPLESRFGTFYAPNITPDPEHGIGAWSREDFLRAMTRGVAPDGRRYYPAFPYTAYTGMDQADLDALWAYLSTEVEAVAEPDRPHELPWYARLPFAMGIWQWLFFEEGATTRSPERSERWNRGAYLADTLAHCGECHTPRGPLGTPIEHMRYAGTEQGPGGSTVPNITPHRDTGIGGWSPDDLAFFLEIGMTPEGDFTGDKMADVVEYGTGRMTPADREALAEYVLSLPPVANPLGQAEEARGAFE